MTDDAGTGSHVPPEPTSPAWSAPPVVPPVVGRRPGRFARAALVAVPALLVGAGVATVITLGVVDHHATTSAASGAATSAAHDRAGEDRTVGTLTSTAGSTWTVKTAKKGSMPVDIGASTAFGSKAHPSQESDFHTGEKVRVAGRASGSSVDATRVTAVRSSSSSSGSTSSSSGSTSSSSGWTAS